ERNGNIDASVNCVAWITLLLLIFASSTGMSAETADAAGLQRRIPFTTSRLVGSPEPPLPYRAKRAFPTLEFKHPLYISHLPQTDQMVVVEQSERILAFTNDQATAVTKAFCVIQDH